MSQKTVFSKRAALLKDGLRKRKLDSLLVTKGVNVSYVSNFSGHDAAVIITAGKSYFITDSRYIEEARASVEGFEIRLGGKSLYEAINEITAERRLKIIGFESMDLPYEVVLRLKKLMPGSVFTPVKGMVEELRAIKDTGEIARVKQSIRLTEDVLGSIRAFIRPGVSERSIAQKIETTFIENGAKAGFDPIVAADANSSKPHAIPTMRKITANSVVMLDVGCALDRYNSDLTRIVTIGKMRPKMAKIYGIVRDAQAKAIELIRPGARIADIDSAARRHIEDKGFGKYFGHALGHGVGLEVHEKPSISAISEESLKPGMIFTVEPAIYIPKFGGIRVEDMVLVTDDGCEILSN